LRRLQEPTSAHKRTIRDASPRVAEGVEEEEEAFGATAGTGTAAAGDGRARETVEAGPDSSPPAVNNLMFFAKKLRERAVHALNRLASPRGHGVSEGEAAAAGLGRRGGGGGEGGGGDGQREWMKELLYTARDLTGSRVMDTPPPPQHQQTELPTPLQAGGGRVESMADWRHESPGLDLADSRCAAHRGNVNACSAGGGERDGVGDVCMLLRVASVFSGVLRVKGRVLPIVLLLESA